MNDTSSNDTSFDDQTDTAGPSGSRSLRGRTVVLGMLAFGVVMVFAMWLYWEMYTRPFRPLQNAIHAEFPGSSPRVVGGRHKSHKDGSLPLLRIVIRVDFDPETADEETLQQHVDRLHALAAQHLDLSPYEMLEVHLIQRVPEEETRRRTFAVPLGS
jgi:hypothetical protein